METFCKRLHGHTVAEDLRLAGALPEWDDAWIDRIASVDGSCKLSSRDYLGLGMRHDFKKNTNTYLPFDATEYEIKSYVSDNGDNAYGTHMIFNLNTPTVSTRYK